MMRTVFITRGLSLLNSSARHKPPTDAIQRLAVEEDLSSERLFQKAKYTSDAH